MADDERGARLFRQGLFKRGGDGVGIGSVDFQHVPVPCLVFPGDILAVHGVDHRGELYLIAVVEHDEVAQAQITGYAAGALGNLLLDATVGDESESLMGHDVPETGLEEAFSDRAPYGHRMALAQRTGGVLDSAAGVKLGMSGAD